MINLFVDLVLRLNGILFNSLGLTIIFIGVLSRIIFYPFLSQSIRYSNTMRDLKPKLDEAKRIHGKDMRRFSSEQSRIFKEAGVNPASGMALTCLGLIVQLVVFFLLFQSLRRVIASGVDTNFLLWNLAKPDVYKIKGFSIGLPGGMVLLTALLTFVQSKMSLPTTTPAKNVEKKSKEPDLTEAMASSQGTLTLIIPLFIIFWGINLASGLILYWFVSTVFGIIQQYFISGLGGLKPWVEKLPLRQ